MELRYALMTLLKILVSTPFFWLMCQTSCAESAALLSAPTINRNASNASEAYYDYDFSDSQELGDHEHDTTKSSEEVPDPSPLVLPGYNLPENIFNHGKPFYVEKDPLTGRIDFNQKSPKLDDDLYDYVDDAETSHDIFDKSNIDRKDGSLSSHHRPSDVNQLTPNFHDFLNLPVKYNSAKYVYPLISSSYASTKVQGSVNKFHNHKDYALKTTTKRPGASPLYYTNSQYFSAAQTTARTTTTTTSTTTTTPKPTSTTKIYLTSQSTNLLDSGMSHPSFMEEFDDYYDAPVDTRKQPATNQVHLSTSPAPVTSTKRIVSLFEQLFGEYDDTVVPVKPTTTTTTTLPSNKYNKYPKTEKPASTTTTTTEPSHFHNSHAGPNLLTGTNMGLEANYEYEDYGSEKYEDNIAVQTKPEQSIDEELAIEPLHATSTEKLVTTTSEASTTTKETNTYHSHEVKATSPAVTTTSTAPTVRVTSLPLGDNHLTTPSHEPTFNRDPIIVATQNLREKLYSEKVQAKPPSTSNVHIAHDQDTVSFVVGNHQSVDDAQYTMEQSPYDSNPFRPLYGRPDNVEAEPEASFQLRPEVVVTIQPQRHSEASVAVGVPVANVKPGQVVDDEELPPQRGDSNKVVFPEDDEHQPEYPDLMPPPKEVLQLSSKPMYHQLPSDLTPPRVPDDVVVVPPPRAVRPPWDPRPGHFYSGKPEYNRPPRPPSDVAYKRIDNLPNILPQFRPNMNNKPPPAAFYKRQPLLERPSNRPVGFFEKLQPPPPPPPPMFMAYRNNQVLRKNVAVPPPRQSLDDLPVAEDRIMVEAPRRPVRPQDPFGLYQLPPQVKLATRRQGEEDVAVETLQMIQSKHEEDNAPVDKDNTDKSIYKVYPVNTPPIKLDVIDDGDKKESVVVGTRAELPLPPSKISAEYNPLFDRKDRNDAPVLKPHPRPPSFPSKSDFPYALERPETPSKTSNELELEPDYFSNNNNNQWNTIGGDNLESRIVTGQKIVAAPNQISVTLKSHPDKPIAVAYTPTEPNLNADKYSMPNYGSAVIAEIRPGTAQMEAHQSGNTASAMLGSVVMDAHNNHRIDSDNVVVASGGGAAVDFEAPFQASVNADASSVLQNSEGWAVVVRDANRTTASPLEVTSVAYATTSEFDIENFKPQLEGGFKPIYSFAVDDKASPVVAVGEREE